MAVREPEAQSQQRNTGKHPFHSGGLNALYILIAGEHVEGRKTGGRAFRRTTAAILQLWVSTLCGLRRSSFSDAPGVQEHGCC